MHYYTILVHPIFIDFWQSLPLILCYSGPEVLFQDLRRDEIRGWWWWWWWWL